MGWSLVHIQHGRGLQDESDQTFRPHTFPLAAESSFQVAGPAATDRDCTCPLASLRECCITVQPNGLTIEVPVWIPPATHVAVCPPLITNATRPHRRQASRNFDAPALIHETSQHCAGECRRVKSRAIPMHFNRNVLRDTTVEASGYAILWLTGTRCRAR
jgi:hypothetical protein